MPVAANCWRSAAVVWEYHFWLCSHLSVARWCRHSLSEIRRWGYTVANLSVMLSKCTSQRTSSRYSFSLARFVRVSTSKIAKTRGGSHISDGNDVIRRLRYLDAISLAFAMRCVLPISNLRSSPDNVSGNACCDACTFNPPMQPRITFSQKGELYCKK